MRPSESDGLERETVVAALVEALAVDPAAHALWLEGADAAGKVDEYSDLDVWLDVEAGSEDAALALVLATLSSLGTIDLNLEIEHPHPQLRQAFLHVAGSSPFLVIDVCVQTHGREVEFGVGDPVKVLFDRSGVIRFRPTGQEVDRAAAAAPLLALATLKRLWVRKALARGHVLEAAADYRANVLGALVTLLRLRYAPAKSGYGLKHAYRDLPAAVLGELERLYRASTAAELEAGLACAEAWMRELAADFERPNEPVQRGRPCRTGADTKMTGAA